MLADWFWWCATSYAVLSVLAVLLLAALIVGYFPLAKYLPVIGPYVEAAKLVAFFAFGFLCFLIGARITDERASLKQARVDLAFSELQLNAQKAAADEAQKLREQAQQQAEQANQKVTEYEAELAKQPPAAGCNLDDGDVNSVRGIAQ